MTLEILINVTPRETRVALVEEGVVEELHIERSNRLGVVGNIYKGKITRVMPGMQAAFVEIGLGRAAFLHMSDLQEGQTLANGMELLVQVLKDPLGNKGARLTTRLSLPSRRLVFVPGGEGIGVSARIDDEAERVRLKALVTEAGSVDKDGYIVRTAAEAATYDEIRTEMLYLRRLWESIRQSSSNASTGSLIHAELPLALRMVRDSMESEGRRVLIDSKETFDAAKAFAQGFIPEALERLEHYAGDRPLFELYGVEEDIQAALHPKVTLKSGGYLVIDQTEALVSVDVNTGAYVGHRNLEETAFKTNLEAAQALARQLRLRNLGGIIIIDFIDMEDEAHRARVLEALEANLARDHARTRIGSISPLGLVEMTRKRTRESLEQVLCEPCEKCAGKGTVKSVETVCYEIFRELLREARQFKPTQLSVVAAPAVVDLMLDQEAQHLAELAEFIGRPVHLQAEPQYGQDEYDVVLS